MPPSKAANWPPHHYQPSPTAFQEPDVADDKLDNDLEQMTGSRGLGKQVKENLRRLADAAAGPELAEMARDVLDGRADLRTLGQSSGYATHLIAAIGRYQQWQASLSAHERDQLIADA